VLQVFQKRSEKKIAMPNKKRAFLRFHFFGMPFPIGSPSHLKKGAIVRSNVQNSH
jgi:hypothetical protein